MGKYYFYCPKCGLEDATSMSLPEGTAPNIRDGFGRPIHHYECPQCHNLDAGYIRFDAMNVNEETKAYFRSVISMYQISAASEADESYPVCDSEEI